MSDESTGRRTPEELGNAAEQITRGIFRGIYAALPHTLDLLQGELDKWTKDNGAPDGGP